MEPCGFRYRLRVAMGVTGIEPVAFRVCETRAASAVSRHPNAENRDVPDVGGLVVAPSVAVPASHEFSKAGLYGIARPVGMTSRSNVCARILSVIVGMPELAGDVERPRGPRKSGATPPCASRLESWGLAAAGASTAKKSLAVATRAHPLLALELEAAPGWPAPRGIVTRWPAPKRRG